MEDILLSNTVDLFKCNISKSRFKKFFLVKNAVPIKCRIGQIEALACKPPSVPCFTVFAAKSSVWTVPNVFVQGERIRRIKPIVNFSLFL